MTDPIRKILHIDMDAFFASVEQRDDPSLKGKPVAVGGSSKRGVVAAASYEARKFGVHSAMPGAVAQRLCPQLIFVRPNFAKYRAASQTVFEIFESITDTLQGMSLDEAYLDVTENHLNEPSATLVAREIKRRIVEAVGLTASAGVASSKSVAKIASGYNKPNGLTVVPPHRTLEFLRPQPIRKIPGIGPKTEERLKAQGIQLIGDIEQRSQAELEGLLGKHGAHIWRLANGIDTRAVRNDHIRKSQSAEHTFRDDVLTIEELLETLVGQSERICQRLTRSGMKGRTVTLKIRYTDFTTKTVSTTLRQATTDIGIVMECAQALLLKTQAGTLPVRLIGIGLSNLVTEEEMEKSTSHQQLTIPSMEPWVRKGLWR